jgi:hypothetical protein
MIPVSKRPMCSSSLKALMIIEILLKFETLSAALGLKKDTLGLRFTDLP